MVLFNNYCCFTLEFSCINWNVKKEMRLDYIRLLMTASFSLSGNISIMEVMVKPVIVCILWKNSKTMKIFKEKKCEGYCSDFLSVGLWVVQFNTCLHITVSIRLVSQKLLYHKILKLYSYFYNLLLG